MKATWTTSSPCSRRAGLTLIEVIAAITILGTLLVGIVLAHARHTHQIALTQRKQLAARVADEMIGRWWTRPEGMPIGEAGVVDAAPSLVWETRIVANPPIERLGARALRLEIREADPPRWQVEAGDETLVQVDLVLPEAARAINQPDKGPEEVGRE